MSIPAIAQAAASSEFRQYLTDLLMEICRIDTTPNPDVAALRDAEYKVFDVLEREFRGYGFQGGGSHADIERRPINPKIKDHPFFSQLYYTKTSQRPNGLSVEDCYAGRANMLIKFDGEQRGGSGVNYAINAHVDVIAPYIPPHIEGDIVYGRGSCDDKGNVVALMGALKLLGAYLKDKNLRLNKNLTAMLVIEEEMGGNGSLSLAMDRELKKRYDSLTVLEICESRLFPGNRGCVWFKIEANKPGVNLFEAAAYIVEELEKEGRSIRSESAHPLFPHRPVQTCHGIIGNCGQHPSRINGEVAFDIVISGGGAAKIEGTVRDVIQFALDEYCGVYGDKTKVNDPNTGKPKVDHHYDLEKTGAGYKITVYGSTGHMGSIFINDGAITKMMTMVRSLIRSRRTLERFSGGKISFRQNGWDDVSTLLMEGGQGFLPTHEMDDVQTRLTTAVNRGGDYYFRMAGVNGPATGVFRVSYDKLHNAAFAGSADSLDMQRAIACAKAAGIWKDADYAQGIRGWDVSCDSRLFAKEYEKDGLNVITTGPGSLVYAHGNNEQINITEMVKFAEFLALYILAQTGTN